MRIGISLISALALTLALLPCSGCRKAQKKKLGKQVRVTLQKPVEREFRERIPIKGTVHPVRFATISARTQGILDDLKVDEGDQVSAGNLLFSIDRVTLENNVTVKREEVAVAETECATAEIELKLAETREEKAKQDFKRGEMLRKSNAMSATLYEDAEVAWKAARAQVQKCEVAVRYRKAKLIQAKTGLQIAEKDLKDAMVTAPYPCLIAEKFHEQGEYVKPGEQLLQIEDISDLEIIAYMSAVYHARVIPGKTPAAISFEGQKYDDAVVTYRAMTIDPETRTFKIKIRLPKTTPLSSGILCNLDIILAQENGFGVPESAILQRGNRTFVYTVTPERTALSCPVERGIADGGFCQLRHAEKLRHTGIVVTGQRFLNDGDRVNIAE